MLCQSEQYRGEKMSSKDPHQWCTEHSIAFVFYLSMHHHAPCKAPISQRQMSRQVDHPYQSNTNSMISTRALPLSSADYLCAHRVSKSSSCVPFFSGTSNKNVNALNPRVPMHPIPAVQRSSSQSSSFAYLLTSLHQQVAFQVLQ
jgi:hypothetical protein